MDDLSWFDMDALNGLDSEIAEIFSTSTGVDTARCAAIAKAVMERAGQVDHLRQERKPSILAAIKEYKQQADAAPPKSRSEKDEPER